MRNCDGVSRKSDHIRICLESDVQGRGISTGFEQVRLLHQALPEMSLSDVDTGTTLAGHALRSPFLVSAMTGGTPEASAINRNLAIAAQELGIAMVVGSQRPAIEDPDLIPTYQVRAFAPDVLLFANLGAVQLNAGFGLDECRRAVEMIEADGLVLHLNPLQECLQPEGDRNFRGLADKIAQVVKRVGVPVMVKEVGWGISARVARLLYDAGIRIVDVAGAGGTSWSEVESRRAPNASAGRVAAAFADWGIPTSEAIANVLTVSRDFAVIASGGVRTGVDAAKAIALGATAVGIALPLLAPACQDEAAVVELLQEFEQQLRIAMFCSSSRTLKDLPSALAPRNSGRLHRRQANAGRLRPSRAHPTLRSVRR
ncbi:MAG: type 2 isopentenyl-diphosphate Delta-isomerase [Anaerolineae bacterium]